MRSLLSLVFALAALCSTAIAATPITLHTDNVHSESASDEAHSHSRALLGSVGAFAQCGGKGMSGKRDGQWANCPTGYYCKKQNYWWWSCQKGSKSKSHSSAAARRKAAAAKKRKAAAAAKRRKAAAAAKRRKAAAAAKRRKAAAAAKRSSSTRRKSSGGNRRSGSSSTRFSSIGDDYQNPTGDYNNPACEKVKSYAQGSHWCRKPPVTGKAPSDRADVKIGRGTIFNGPAWTQIGHCAKRLWPVDDVDTPTKSSDWHQNYVKVAASSFYMNNFGEYPCGRKLCIQIIGYDESSNPNPPPYWRELVRNGTAMPGIVWDQCPECEQDHIDFLGQYPFSPAKMDQWNPYGATANSLWSDVNDYYITDVDKVYGVGTMKVMWGWNDNNEPCSSYF